jgi:hypothetical protein
MNYNRPKGYNLYVIVDILLFFIQFVFYAGIGFSILGRFNFNYLFIPKWIIWTLTGLSIFIWGSSVFIHFSLPVKYWPLFLASLTLLLIINKIEVLKNTLKFFRFKNLFYDFRNYIFVISIVGVGYLLNPSIRQSAVSIRTGPDTIGWLSSAKLLQDESSITNLFGRLQSSLNSSEVLLGFHHASNSVVPSIYTIPSFQDQVNAEFLIGAHRTGIPGLVGSISYWLGEGSLYHVTNGLILLASFLLAFIGYAYLKSKNVSEPISILVATLLTFNANFFSVIMQGGIAQGLLTPYLLVIILQLTTRDKSNSLWKLSMFIFLVTSLSTYLDIALFLLLFMAVYSLVGTPKRAVSIIKEYVGKSLTPAAIGLIVCFPILSSLPRLLIDRLTSGSYGGWAQGRIPMPSDFLGATNWLPADGFNNRPRGLFFTILVVLISFVLLTVVSQSRKLEGMKVVISTLGIYFIFMLNTYASLHRSANNYVLYKASAYSMFSIVIFAGIFFAKSNTNKSSKRHLEKLFMPVFLVLTILTSIGAVNDWLVFRSQTISLQTKQVMSEIVSKYDFNVVGFKGVDKAKFVMLGDVHYLDATRGFNLVTQRTVPQRPLLYLVPPYSCKSTECVTEQRKFSNRSKFERIVRVPEFNAYIQIDTHAKMSNEK